eukprot:m.394985 g.394985  ORF g.394985 m.394985 type:complete len:132 (-) comp56382_c0_seq2:2196-2591(-)
MILGLYIVNKAGTLLYHNECRARKLSPNESIMLASTFHGISAIAGQLSPSTNNSGIQWMEADTFKLYCYRSHTGLQFMVLADPAQAAMESLTRLIYEAYADFVMKNPFYALDQPIRAERFEAAIKQLLDTN